MLSSEEKDPTCVVQMLQELLPASQRAAAGSRLAARRKSSVVTRLEFEDSSRNERAERAFTNKRKAFSSFTSVEKKSRSALGAESSATVPPSPWEYRLLKGDFLKAKGQIETLENLIRQLHGLRREQEAVFENEKISITSKLECKDKLIRDLESRIDVLTRRNADTREELAELRSDAAASKQNTYKKLLALEKENAELKSKVGEYELNERTNDVGVQLQLTQLQTELDAAREFQADYEKRVAELETKLKESNKANRETELLELKLQTAESRAQSLAAELEEGKELVSSSMRQQAKLAKFPEMERELDRMREDNIRLRGLVQNKLILEEKVACLTSRLSQSEERDRDAARIASQLRSAEATLAEWALFSRHAAGDEAARPAVARVAFDRLQQRELQLTAELADVKSRLRMTIEAKNGVVAENEGLKAQIEKLNNMLELQKSYVHRVNKKLQLVSIERNSYRAQLDSYERDLTMPVVGGSQQTEQQRARIDALEQALNGYRELVERLEKDLARDKDIRAAPGNMQTVEKVSALESEKLALLEENGQLKRKMEEIDMENKFRALKGDFNPTKSKVLHLRLNPQSEAVADRADELRLLRAECTRLREMVRVLREGQTMCADVTVIADERLKTSNSQEVTELRNQVKSFELKLQRLKEAFKATSNDFREVVYTVLGFRIDRKTSQEYHLSSMYAESPDDVLVFKYNETGELDMIGTPFSNTLTSLIDLHLRRQQSIPVFLSAVTMDLFSQQTMVTITEPTII